MRGKTTGIVECMSLIHYPQFLLFKTSPVITVVPTYINTTVISFGKWSTYDIYPQQAEETQGLCMSVLERRLKMCIYRLFVCLRSLVLYSLPPAELRPFDKLVGTPCLLYCLLPNLLPTVLRNKNLKC